jgi:hypothetical protein
MALFSASKRIRQTQWPLPSTKNSVLAKTTAHVTRTPDRPALFARRPVATSGHTAPPCRSDAAGMTHEDLRHSVRARNIHAPMFIRHNLGAGEDIHKLLVRIRMKDRVHFPVYAPRAQFTEGITCTSRPGLGFSLSDIIPAAFRRPRAY